MKASALGIQLIRVTIAVIVLVTVVALFPGLIGIGYHLAGRSGICNLGESYRAARVSAKQVSGKTELEKQSKQVTRGADGLNLWETPLGSFWAPNGSTDALFLDLAEQNRRIYGTLRKGDVVLDCGANIGLFTKKALQDGASLVVAIEPAPENLECLRRNLKAEIEQKRVIVVPKGVWNKDDVLTMHIDPANSAANSFVRQSSPNATHVKLPLTTVDKIVSELSLEKIDFMKMDIEGAERQALEGARQTIQKFRPRMSLCVYHLGDDPVVIPQLVQQIRPDYQRECGCLQEYTQVAPQVVHYR